MKPYNWKKTEREGILWKTHKKYWCTILNLTWRSPGIIVADKEKNIWIYGMVCPQESNIKARKNEKRTKYRQLAFELCEGRPGYISNIVLHRGGGGITENKRNLSDCNGIRTHNHLVRKQTVNHLAKLSGNHSTLRSIWLNAYVRLRTKWLWV